MTIDTFFPANDRFALAMRLNNLLAAPGFEVLDGGCAAKSEEPVVHRQMAGRASR